MLELRCLRAFFLTSLKIELFFFSPLLGGVFFFKALTIAGLSACLSHACLLLGYLMTLLPTTHFILCSCVLFCSGSMHCMHQHLFSYVAKREGIDVVLVDTAGRMQNNAPLMAALAKVRRRDIVPPCFCAYSKGLTRLAWPP